MSFAKQIWKQSKSLKNLYRIEQITLIIIQLLFKNGAILQERPTLRQMISKRRPIND